MKNVNIGVLGHVDAGKTSLCMALSSISSTAAFDKNPQSKERGITLDLGFSALSIDDDVQLTFVDCPGHASLIRTVIGGAQIINYMLLVVDITKGLQAQTLECIVIATIICPRMIVVLNKTDKLDPTKRDLVIQRMSEKIQKTFADKGLQVFDVVPCSATENENLENLRQALINAAHATSEAPATTTTTPKSFLFSIDHCFTIRGKGTICTGTVLQGETKVGDTVEIPQLNCQRVIKSIEMFRKPLAMASKGDRLGICITQFDAKQLERGTLCTPGTVPFCFCAVIQLKVVELFKGAIRSKIKFHVSVGHATVLARLTLFRCVTGEPFNTAGGVYEFVEEFVGDEGAIFAVLEFEKPILWTEKCLLIGSKLDLEPNTAAVQSSHSGGCRLAFYGTILAGSSIANYQDTFLGTFKLFRRKSKIGSIQRVANDREIIVEDFFKKSSNREVFIGMKVHLSTGQRGNIEGTFGKTSKVKITLDKELTQENITNYRTITVTLDFKKLLFCRNKQIFQ